MTQDIVDFVGFFFFVCLFFFFTVCGCLDGCDLNQRGRITTEPQSGPP